MTIDEIIAQLAGQKPDEVVAALHKSAQPVYQLVFDKGHSTATQAAKLKLDEAVTKSTAQEAELATVKGQLEEAQKSKPDVAKIHEQYQTQIRDLKDGHKKELEKVNGTLRRERLGGAKSKARADLIAKGVDPDYADVQVQKNEQRLSFNDKGELQVMQAGKDIPFSAADGKTGLDLLVEELDKAVPPKFRVSGADTGGGVDGKQPTGGGKNLFDKIRDDAKKEQEKKAAGSKPLEERLGMPKASA